MEKQTNLEKIHELLNGPTKEYCPICLSFSVDKDTWYCSICERTWK